MFAFLEISYVPNEWIKSNENQSLGVNQAIGIRTAYGETTKSGQALSVINSEFQRSIFRYFLPCQK